MHIKLSLLIVACLFASLTSHAASTSKKAEKKPLNSKLQKHEDNTLSIKAGWTFATEDSPPPVDQINHTNAASRKSEDYLNAYQAYSVGVYSSAPSTFDGYKDYLKTNSTTLLSTKQSRQVFISLLGERLLNGYNRELPPFTSLESIFRNMRANGTNGGVCRDIHAF
ncbi:MAG: hypothetical protein HQK54_14520, partial [Oligoflexales bacterium]|nr:hypothetical protein [Oligoflexales bacterium]